MVLGGVSLTWRRFGSRILVAPSPYPEDMTPYVVQLPPGTWYDYWTNEQFVRGNSRGQVDLELSDSELARKPIKISPTLEELPIYVRGGSILPIAPLTEEVPPRSRNVLSPCVSTPWRRG